MSNYYKPSGKFSPLSIVYFIVLSLTAFPLLGLIYAYCIWYMPFIYINFLITIGFGFVVSALLYFVVIKIGKVRNVPVAVLFGILGGLITLYFHWVVWVDLAVNSGENYVGITVSNIKFGEALGLAIRPRLLFDLIKEINTHGTWQIYSYPVSGLFLAIIWVVEACMVVTISTGIPFTTSKLPFCEISNKWFKENVLPEFNFIDNQDEMLSTLEKSNDSFFNELARVEKPLEESHSIFTLFSSENGKIYLSILNKLAKTDKKGEVSFDEDKFVECINITEQMKETLLEKVESA